jgi:hypothetical protein
MALGKTWFAVTFEQAVLLWIRDDDIEKGQFGFVNTGDELPVFYLPAGRSEIALTACAATTIGEVHFCGTAPNPGPGHPDQQHLWHTLRGRLGGYGKGWQNVMMQTDKVGPDPGPILRVACATTPTFIYAGVPGYHPGRTVGGDLHILAITDEFFDLYHTVRLGPGNPLSLPEGSWPYPFSWVNPEARGGGPEIVGPTPVAACATNHQGDVHVIAANREGELYWTLRRGPNNPVGPEGTWAKWINVQSKTDPLGHVLGPVKVDPQHGMSIACATNLQGALHVLVLDAESRLWHTIRHGTSDDPADPAPGTWVQWGPVDEQTGPFELTPSNVTCTCGPGDVLNVFVTTRVQSEDTDGTVYFVLRDSVGNWSGVFNVTDALHLNSAFSVSASHEP